MTGSLIKSEGNVRERRRVAIPLTIPKKTPSPYEKGLHNRYASTLSSLTPTRKIEVQELAHLPPSITAGRCRGFVGPVPQPLLMRSEVLFN